MAGINDYSNTAGSNTTINSIDISEGCSPAGINNAIRQLMADIADMDDGVVPLQTPDINGGTIDGAAISGSSTIDNSIIGGTTPAAGTFTTLTANTSATISGDLTVDTDTLYVDTTNNRVGVKNASPTVELDVTGEAKISGDLTVDTNTLYVDSSNNRVGVGTSSPAEALHITTASSSTTAVTGLKIQNSADLNGENVGISFGSPSFPDGGEIYAEDQSSDGLVDICFALRPSGGGNPTERMRIDSSGNLLVGVTTNAPTTTAGINLNSNNKLHATRSAGASGYFNRLTNDGSIVEFAKDGTTVGSIGADSDDIVIDGTTNHVGIRFLALHIRPRYNGADADNTIDLGGTTHRFDDIYATNGTIQTSDQNEKQSIQSLTASEMAVAQRISKLFKTFKFNSAVEEKGDNARTHTGIIAQDVQQAFTDEGLDASNYALFISSTWWEKEISVDAVAPQEAVYETQTDEEGNEIQVLVQEAVEGKDAYTYMDIKEKATEGYTERTRLGIRYPELLSFVSSAFEQRLTNIETRLTALEA